MSDKIDIYRQFLCGDPKGFNSIYLEYGEPLMRYASKRLLRHDAAQDVVSDAFALLFSYIGKFKSGEHIHNFLYRAVWYKIHTEHRIAERFKVLPEDAEDLSDLSTLEIVEIRESAIHIQWVVDKIHEKLKELPLRRGQDFYAHYFESKSLQEIARERSVTVDTVRQNIEFARKELEKGLKKVGIFFSKSIGF
jgi:RNA polymerase sigma factor (sigma-70 family)